MQVCHLPSVGPKMGKGLGGSCNLRKQSIFYGWWIVLFSTVISVWVGAVVFSITAFVKPIVAEFGWLYWVVSLAASARTVEMGLFAPVAGFLTDRIGPRKVTLSGGLVTGLGLFLLSRTHSLLLFFVAFFMLSVGLSGLGHAVTTTAVANWFDKKIGRAIGFTLTGYALGGVFVPLVAWFITQYGWRSSLMILAVATWLVVPSAALFFAPQARTIWTIP